MIMYTHQSSTDKDYRGLGIGYEVLELFLSYYNQYIKKYVGNRIPIVKINYNNKGSIELFKKLSFIEYKRVDVFQELELRLMKLNDGNFNRRLNIINYN